MQKLTRYIARHHWGLLATFRALGGSAYAAVRLAPDSVGTRQLRDRAVTLEKIGPRAQGRTGRRGQAPAGGEAAASNGDHGDQLLVRSQLNLGAGAGRHLLP